MSSGRCQSGRQLQGQLVIVTGASAGIGKETARDLARRGARVIMACRNLAKAQKVADDIIRTTGNDQVEVQELDTSSLRSVRTFSNHIIDTEDKVNILVNNAGVGFLARQQETEDGFELTMATNHYGHFLLTNMLGKVLKAGAPSRIVCVTSDLHAKPSKLDPEDLNFRRGDYNNTKAYGQSKLCNVLMARALAKRLKGTGVTSYSVHPGWINTELFFKNDGSLLFRYIAGPAAALFAKDEVSGAQTSIYCAVDEKAGQESGLYYSDCKALDSSKLGQDETLAAKLWTASALDVKLQPNEANI